MKKSITTGLLFSLIFMLFVAPISAQAAGPTEPKCVRTGFLLLKKDCKARDLYRNISSSTKSGSAVSVQKAALTLGVGLNKSARSQLEYVARNTSKRNAKCLRKELLSFISSNANSMRLSGNFQKAFDAAGKGVKFLGGSSGLATQQVLKAGKALVNQSKAAVTSKQLEKLQYATIYCS